MENCNKIFIALFDKSEYSFCSEIQTWSINVLSDDKLKSCSFSIWERLPTCTWIWYQKWISVAQILRSRGARVEDHWFSVSLKSNNFNNSIIFNVTLVFYNCQFSIQIVYVLMVTKIFNIPLKIIELSWRCSYFCSSL